MNEPRWPVARVAAVVSLAAAAGVWLLALLTAPSLAAILLAAGPVIAGPMAYGLVEGRAGVVAFGTGALLLVATGGATVGPVGSGWAAVLGAGTWVAFVASIVSLATRADQVDPRALRGIVGAATALGAVGLAVGTVVATFADGLPERTAAIEGLGVVTLVTAIGMLTAQMLGRAREERDLR
jgi:hypothetical protein